MTFKNFRQLKGFFTSRRFYCSFPRVYDANLDWNYFCDPKNHGEIIDNCRRRLVKQDVSPLLQKASENQKDLCFKSEMLKDDIESLRKKLIWLPNRTHPRVMRNATEDPVLIEEVGSQPTFTYHPATFDSLAKRLNVLRTQFLGHISGPKSYFLKQDLARLERALVNYAVERLLKQGFVLVSVPDIVNKSVLECCGMKTQGEHSQVFHIHKSRGEGLCLSGTAEMSLAAFCARKCFPLKDLPLRLCAVSRCFRAEAKKNQTEKGIYRVHYFTKVEMFGVTSDETGNESELLLSEFTEIQKKLFSDLGLHFKVLEMPPCELGLPAFHKYDIETWMPGRKIYGEISSASNCTDYQSRRLSIRYQQQNKSVPEKYCHTVNATACAIPRMLIALFENHQNYDGSISIPTALQGHFGKDRISGRFPEKMECMKPVG